MQEPQSNLEKKKNPYIFKDYFSSRADPFNFVSVTREVLDQSNENGQDEFFRDLHQQVTLCPSPQCLIGQIQVQKSTLFSASTQMPYHT